MDPHSESSMKPVVIVGAGPTGMTAAMELSRFGIPVRLVEKAAEPATTSRAIGVQARTLELFEQRGLVDALLAVGHRGVAGSIYGGGERVFRLPFADLESRYPYLLFVSQAETERVLRERLAASGVTIERCVELVAFGQREVGHDPRHDGAGDDGVTVVLKHGDGRIETVAASFLVGAEGAHSVVRTTLGLRFAGRTRDESYALGDLDIDGELADSDFHIFSSEHGFMGLFPMGDRRFRLIASNPLSEPAPDTRPALEELQKIYDMRSPVAARFRDLRWSSWFRINSRMVDRLRTGRAFVGGDAAHIHSPAGAQGMNTGIQDMVNLSWKLALVLRGRASPALLDTYDDDRLPVIRGVLAHTEGLTDAIGSENAAFRSIFNHIAPLVVGTEFVQRKSTTQMSQIGLHYRDSPLSETRAHHGDLRAGDRMPDFAVRTTDGTTTPLFGLLDASSFTVLLAGDAASPGDDALAPWPALLRVHRIAPADGADAERFAKHLGTRASLLLVRPDGYLGFLGGDGDEAALVDWLTRWITPDGCGAATPSRD